MKLPDFLIDYPGGEIRLRGHRVSLYHLLDAYQSGASPEDLHEEYPTVALLLIRQVLDFYRANRTEVDSYLTEYRAELARLEQRHPSSATASRLRERANRNGPSTPPRPR